MGALHYEFKLISIAGYYIRTPLYYKKPVHLAVCV